MSPAMTRMISRMLVALMVWAPFHIAQAGVISTEQVINTAGMSDRAAVLGAISRADVASQLQALGIDPASAKDRVAALTDQEVRSLAERMQSLPAGAGSGAGVVLILVILLVWYLWK